MLFAIGFIVFVVVLVDNLGFFLVLVFVVVFLVWIFGGLILFIVKGGSMIGGSIFKGKGL